MIFNFISLEFLHWLWIQ